MQEAPKGQNRLAVTLNSFCSAVLGHITLLSATIVAV
jgi:hypothetical protein